MRVTVFADVVGVDELVDTGRADDAEALATLAVRIAKAQLVTERLTLSAAQRLFDTGERRRPGPALAQCPHRCQPQPAGVQGARHRQLPGERQLAAGKRLLLGFARSTR